MLVQAALLEALEGHTFEQAIEAFVTLKDAWKMWHKLYFMTNFHPALSALWQTPDSAGTVSGSEHEGGWRGIARFIANSPTALFCPSNRPTIPLTMAGLLEPVMWDY
ncbi:hypothetical protein B0H13DRAFT_1919857 [Mycena leptocephala]|nr:hypothetical protein B0H13DRAFT_1919857 [Mycena leptocephala]